MPPSSYHDSTPLLFSSENGNMPQDVLKNQTASCKEEGNIRSRKEIEKGRGRILLTFWPLVLQTLLSILLAGVTLALVDGQVFNSTSRRLDITQPDGSTSHLGYILLQTDVTTAISGCLTAIRFLGGLWTAGTVRRCIFILLEKHTLTLGNIQWMLTWSLPARFQARNTNATPILISLILLMSFPSQFSSPLLTGSISWTPSHSLFPGQKQLGGISFSAAGESWVNYAGSPVQIGEAITREAGGISDLQWGIGSDSASNSMKRALPSARNLPIGSTLRNVTLPALIILSIEWIKDPSSIPEEQRAPVLTGGNLNPFDDAEHPVVAIVPHPNNSWGPALTSHLTFPEPSQVSETRLLVTLVDRIFGISDASGCPTHSNTRYYGAIPTDIGLFQAFYQGALNGTNVTNCYAFANVNYSAGVVPCNQCQLSSFLVVDGGNITVTRDQLQDDPMVLTALGLAPVLTSYTVAGNVSVPSPIGNIDNFARVVLSRSYQACWVALSNRFPPASELLSTEVDIALTTSLQANVSPWRVHLWLFTNLLLAITGIISWSVQNSCNKPFVIDSEVAMLLLDTENIHKNDKRHLQDLTILTPEDITQVGLLRLKVDEVTHRRVLTSRKVACA